ncbi:RagB/SusD family nutrient uptake outer membrane protein [Sphingobacterium anhuiense]|uniref:RagB/SusD family nutrient uptake outer membrane protein n=1 Tax=Sphingobacterium anhuiense TaxID=493780 RepID=A0ABW5YSS3_9SPHI
MKNIVKSLQYIALGTVVLMQTGCKDFLDANSSTATSENVVLSSASQLERVLTATYRQLYFNDQGMDRVYAGLPGLQMYVDLGGADIVSHTNMGGNQVTAYTYEPQKTQTTGLSNGIWTMMYKIINQTNIIIEALPAAQGEETLKNQIMGQAKAIRGLCYFHLIQNYQQTYMLAKQKPGVILRLSPKESENLPRATVEQTYAQIVKDLTDAKSLLANYTQPNKWTIDKYVVSGQLARVYSVMNNWQGAYQEAKTAYTNYSQLMTKTQYQSGFDDVITNNYAEVMWAVPFTTTNNLGGGTQFNFWYNQDESYGEGYTDGPIYSFLDFFADGQYEKLFEKTEDRYQFWKRTKNASKEWSTKWAYNKYKHYGDANGAKQGNTRPEVSLMRGSEMLLIMAEASTQLNNGEGLGYLNRLQTARGVKGLTVAASGTPLLEAIYVERRKELLCEGVTGIYDLLRLQKPLVRIRETATYVEGHYTWGVTNLNGYVASSPAPTGTFPSNDYRMLCQIPQLEIANNTALSEADQNPYSGTN